MTTTQDTACAASGGLAAVRRNCPLCNADAHDLVCRHDPWRLVRCQQCSLAYLPEIPSEAALADELEWGASFSRERRRRWLTTPWMRAWTLLLLPLLLPLRPSRQRRALRRIRRFAAPGRLLEVGCGDGRLLAAALRAGFDPLGIELSPAMAAKARRRVPAERVKCGRLADFDLGRGQFDVVVTVSYLEHDPQPLATLERIHSLLRPNGTCVHKVPNFASLLPRILGRKWSGYRWPEHVQYFTPATLARMLARAGFEIVETRAHPLGDNLWVTGRRK